MGTVASITDKQSITAQAVETDVNGAVVAVADPTKLAWTIDDPTIADLTVDAAGVATFKALKAGVANVSVVDGSNGLKDATTLIVIASGPGPAANLAITFGTPTP